MALFLIPTGKSWKFWIAIAFGVSLIGMVYIGYSGLIENINNGIITSPVIIFLARIFYPVYSGLVWYLNYIGTWGVLGMIPLIPVFIIPVLIWSWFFGKYEKYKENNNPYTSRKNAKATVIELPSGEESPVFECENCRQKLRVPSKEKIIIVTCPKCKSSFKVKKGKKI